MNVTIRAATPSDRPALSRICLLTAAAGASAESEHTLPALPGLVYAEPYAATDLGIPGFGFVLETDGGEVVGYVLGTPDTRAFADALDERWWPAQRAAYPLALVEPPSTLTAADAMYVRKLHAPDRTADAVLARAAAHMHIDILPHFQRRGFGRRLIAAAARHLLDAGATTLHLGIDPRNDAARAFYNRIGFERIDPPGVGGEWYLLDLASFLRD